VCFLWRFFAAWVQSDIELSITICNPRNQAQDMVDRLLRGYAQTIVTNEGRRKLRKRKENPIDPVNPVR